jgi:hypothetical protein
MLANLLGPSGNCAKKNNTTVAQAKYYKFPPNPSSPQNFAS